MANVSLNNNKLGYTNLTYQDIEQRLTDILSRDERTKNFMQSSLAKVILDNFIASTDLTNFYIERTAEECFLETANHLSSVILGAQQIGYVPRRPIGGRMAVQMTVTDPYMSISVGDKLKIDQVRNTVTINGKTFVFTSSYEYVFTSDDITELSQGSHSITIQLSKNEIGSNTDTDVGIKQVMLVQGEEKIIRLYPGVQAGMKYQKYKIDHPEFSNYYGSADIAQGDWVPSNDGIGGKFKGSRKSLTRVAIVKDEADTGAINDGSDFFDLVDSGSIVAKELHINRRSLFSDDFITKVNDLGETRVPCCLIKSNKDTSCDIVFGDDEAVGPIPETGEHIVIKYLATNGASSNETGVIGKDCQINGELEFITPTNEAVKFTGTVTLNATTNIMGGSDFESIDSIRYSAPKVFSSMERLVTKDDYENYLRTLTDPFDVAHAQAWGEQEECKRRGVPAIKEFCNNVLYTVIGSPYYKDGTKWKAYEIMSDEFESHKSSDNNKEASNVFVEGADSGYRTSAWFDWLINSGKTDSTSESNTRFFVDKLNEKVSEKSQLTVINSYVPPYVHGYEIKGRVTLEDFAERNTIIDTIKNAIYGYLNSTSVINTPIYKSDITSLIENIVGVKNSDIYFEPIKVSSGSLPNIQNWATDLFAVNTTAGAERYSEEVLAATIEYVENYVDYKSRTVDQNLRYAPSEDSYEINDIRQTSGLYSKYPDNAPNTTISPLSNVRIDTKLKNVNVWHIYNVFFKKLWELVSVEGCSVETFIKAMDNGRKALAELLDRNVMDENGNLTNFSMDNEMTMLYLDESIVGY